MTFRYNTKCGGHGRKILMVFSKIKSFFSAKDAVKRMKAKPWLRKYLWNTCLIRCYHPPNVQRTLQTQSWDVIQPDRKMCQILQRCLPKKDVQMTHTHVKTWFIPSIIIKPRSRCLGCSKSRALAAPNAGQMWSNRSVHSLLVGVQNGTATSQDNSAVSYKTKYFLTMSLSHCVPWYLAKWTENCGPYKNVYTIVCSSSVHKCQSLETTQIFSSK